MKLTATVYSRTEQLKEYRTDAEDQTGKITEYVEFHYHELADATKNKKSNLEKWASDSGAETREAVQNGTKVLSDALASFLSKLHLLLLILAPLSSSW